MHNKISHRWKEIGVVGGLGPRASAYFYETIINLCSDQYDAILDHEYPRITLHSLASDGLSEMGKAEENLIQEINEVLMKFAMQGLELVAIPCNSIFAHFDNLFTNDKLKVINLPKILADRVAGIGAKNVGILCSQELRDSGAYDPYFNKKGVTPHYPDSSRQAIVNKSIMDVMGNKHSDETVQNLMQIISDISVQNESVLIACTELSVLLSSSPLSNKVFDSTLILCEETLDCAFEL